MVPRNIQTLPSAAANATWQFLNCTKSLAASTHQLHESAPLNRDSRWPFDRTEEHAERIEQPLRSDEHENESNPYCWPRLCCNLHRLFCRIDSEFKILMFAIIVCQAACFVFVEDQSSTREK